MWTKDNLQISREYVFDYLQALIYWKIFGCCWWATIRDIDLAQRERQEERLWLMELQPYVLGKDDIISQLPDDILALILAHLPSTRDASRTSVLSKRWMNLHKLVPQVTLTCSDFLSTPTYSLHRHECSDAILSGLLGYLHGVPGLRRRKITSLRLRCCMDMHEYPRLLIYLPRDVESFDLCFSCCEGPRRDISFPFGDLDRFRSLRFLGLSSCYVREFWGWNFSCSLQTIELRSVKVYPNALECIMSSCFRLHSLSILECKLPHKISIVAAANAALFNSLTIRHCRGVEEIRVCATNLSLLEFASLSDQKGVDFLFDHRLLHLQTLHFSVPGQDSMPLVFWKYANDFPNLRYLALATTADFFLEESSRLMKRDEIGMFVELRRLELRVCCTPKLNLLSLIPILQSFPLLEEFQLDMQNLDYEEGPYVWPHLRKWSKNYECLKKVEMSGFNGEENEIEFGLHILRSAAMLEQMNITWYPKCYNRCCGWKTLAREKWKRNKVEAIQQKLQGQALSKNAQLIIVNKLQNIHKNKKNVNLKIDKVPSIGSLGRGLADVLH